MIKILNKREQLILFSAIAVFIFGICFNFLFIPVLNKNESLDKEIGVTKAKLKKYIRILNQKENIKNEYNKSSLRFANREKKEEPALVNVLSELQDLAKASNIRIIDIRPQSSPGSASFLKEGGVDLQTEGQIQSYLKFIYTIENSFSLLDIKRFRLKVKPNSEFLEGDFTITQLSGNELL